MERFRPLEVPPFELALRAAGRRRRRRRAASGAAAGALLGAFGVAALTGLPPGADRLAPVAAAPASERADAEGSTLSSPGPADADCGDELRQAFVYGLAGQPAAHTPVEAAEAHAARDPAWAPPTGRWAVTRTDGGGAVVASGSTSLHVLRSGDGLYAVDSGTRCPA
jgi:hypothetical protein